MGIGEDITSRQGAPAPSKPSAQKPPTSTSVPCDQKSQAGPGTVLAGKPTGKATLHSQDIPSVLEVLDFRRAQASPCCPGRHRQGSETGIGQRYSLNCKGDFRWLVVSSYSWRSLSDPGATEQGERGVGGVPGPLPPQRTSSI
jgi:hypothetical protein